MARRRLLWALAVGVALTAVGPSAGATADGPELRAMTYNIQGNVAYREGRWDPAAVAAAISAQNADVIGLQEVCDWQLADLLDRLEPGGWSDSAHRITVGGAVCGNYGIGLLSKLPLEDVSSAPLPPQGEPRAVLSATVEAGEVPVRVFNTHLPTGAGLEHTEALAAEVAQSPMQRKILTGDLNVQPSNTATLRPLADLDLREVDHPLNRPTHSSTNPTRKIDYIYVSDPIAVGAVAVPQTTASDHLPLWSDLELGDPVEGTGLIAFDSDRDGDREILVMTPIGDGLLQVTDNAAADTDPAFSPDGSRIAFVSNRDANNEIYVMDRDGSNQTRLTNFAGDDLDPAWSPDGTKLAIRRNDGTNEIYVIDASDGGNAANLTSNSDSNFAPDWSPDGAKVAYQRFRSPSGGGVGFGNEVMVMDADGSNQVNLTNNLGTINDGQPSWSPDGSWIAFRNNSVSSQHDIYTMEADGTNRVRRTGSSQLEGAPAWSPDGTAIAFTRATAEGGTEVFTMNVDPAGTGLGTGVSNRSDDPADDDRPSWSSDETPPETEIVTGPGEGARINQPAPSFGFSSSEAGSRFECSVDGAAFEACESPFTTQPLAEGMRSFAVRAIDLAGNPDPTPAARSFTVDLTAPTATIDGGPDDPSNDPTAEFAFSSNEPGSTFECRLDSVDEQGFEPCTSPVETGELGEGEHSFDVRAIDEAGNTGAPAPYAWEIDLTAPETEIADGPSGPTNQPVSTFAFASPDDPTAAFECRLAPGAWETCTSPFETGELGEGPHAFEVRAVDPAGNPDPSPAGSDFVVDLTSPALEIVSGPSGAVASESAEFTFSAADAVGSSPALECRWDAEAFQPCSSPDARDDLAQGPHTFRVRATDEAGNAATAERGWSVDTVAPTTTITSAPPDPSPSSGASFGFGADEPAGFECSLDGAPPEPCDSPVSYQALAPGSHAFRVRATDAAGNAEPSPATYVWRIAPLSGGGGVAGAVTDSSGDRKRCIKKAKRRFKKSPRELKHKKKRRNRIKKCKAKFA